jgi:hypothetical protein
VSEPECDSARKPDIEDREVLLDEREAVPDTLQELLSQADTGQAAVRGERAANATSSRVPWRDRYPLGAESAALTDRMLSTTDPHDVIHHVERTAVRLVPGATVASVMILGAEDRFHTSAGADPLAVQLGEAQHQAGEGPCQDATRSPGPKLSRCDDLAAPDTPWPRFSPAAVDLGIRSVAAVGLLPLSPARLGALHIYGREAHAFTDADVEATGVLASHLAVALLVLTQLDQTQGQLTHLWNALDTRDIIGQAKGILMARRHVTAGEAFALLSATSQRLNIKLRDLAQQVVQTGHL